MMKRVFLVYFLIGAFYCFSQENRIVELQNIISDSEKISNVSARSNINQYWELADLLFLNGRNKEGYEILIKGLTLDPWNYKYQQKAAEYEISQKNYAQANTRLAFITKNLQESYDIYASSSQKLKEISKAVQESSGKQSVLSLDGKYYIYLVAYPYVSDQLIDVVSNRISVEYGITVKTISMGTDESVANIRNSQLEEYDRIISDVKSKYSEKAVNDFLQSLGLSNDDLKTEAGKKRFVYGLLSGSKEGLAQWEQLEKIESQYSADAQLTQMKQYLKEKMAEKNCLGLVALTSKDLYANDYNFLFGWAQKGIGIFSFSRFQSRDATYRQIEKRTVMQAFSTVGLVLGIPRCSNPTCARAYPNSLEEQDRKEDKLCEDCRKKTQALYASYNQ